MFKPYNLGRVPLLILGMMYCTMQANAQEESWTPTGTGSEEYPYQISSLFDLYNYASRIEKIENYSKDKFFVLTADISIQDATIIDGDGNLVADTTKLTKWDPIGTEYYGKSFSGTFDGQGHTISGIYVDARDHKYSGYAGLFGHMSGTVRNLTITNSYFCGGNNLGAFAGQMDGDNALIENCVNYATVCGENAPTMQIGGIFGYTYYGQVNDCSNHGKIILNPKSEGEGLWNCSAGGIGGSGGSITSCDNHGEVVSYGWGGAGGIVGSPRYVTACTNYGSVEDFNGNTIGGINGWSGNIRDCENHGQVVSHSKGAKIGGIGGHITAGGRVINCVNYSTLQSQEAEVWIGGICGYGDIDGYTETYLMGCTNYGDVATTDQTSYCAGIVPYLYHAEARSCKNYGDVSSVTEAGGIAALAMAHGNISNSENHGTVTGTELVGGIAGQTACSVYGCLNTGDITLLSGSRVGGIVGYMSSSSSYTIDCANIGDVTTMDNSMIGGIVGNSSSYGTIHCSYNSGDITSYGDSWMGGIAGYMSNGIYDCYNKGNIINYGSGSCLAGIAGWSNSSIENAFTTGYIYCFGQNETVGHMVSGTYTSINGFARKTNLYYSNTIVGTPAKHTNATQNWQFTQIAEDELNGLTDTFNDSRDYYESGGWVAGYFHPVLKRYYATEDSNYDSQPYNFQVTSSTGDTCRIDLGIPFDNTIFTTDHEDNSQLCCNTIHDGNRVNRLWVVDHKDFAIHGELEISKATMRINDIRPLTAKVLPWDIAETDLPEGASLYKYVNHDNDSTVIFNRAEAIEAGEAMLMQLPDTVKVVSITKKSSHMSMPTAKGEAFQGTFATRLTSPSQYLLNTSNATFVKSDGQTRLMAFDASLNIADNDNDRMYIDFTGLSSVDVNISQTHKIQLSRAGQLAIAINGLSDPCDIVVYDINGNTISVTTTTDTSAIVNVPSTGIYIIRVNDNIFKIAL